MLLGISSMAMAASGAASNADLQLRYVTPAKSFNEALPLGNGRMGVLVYGGVAHARYSLSENSMWSGSRYPAADRKDSASYPPKFRQLLLAGRNVEAEPHLQRLRVQKPDASPLAKKGLVDWLQCAWGTR